MSSVTDPPIDLQADPQAMSQAFRMEEYKTLVAELTSFQQQAQTTNSGIFAVNALFMTGLGAVLVSASLGSWWVVGISVCISIIMTPANWAWQRIVIRNRRGRAVRITYLRELEASLFASQAQVQAQAQAQAQSHQSQSQSVADGLPLGLFRRLKETRLEGNSWVEILVTWIVPYFYIVITIALAILTYLITQHIILPLRLTLR